MHLLPERGLADVAEWNISMELPTTYRARLGQDQASLECLEAIQSWHDDVSYALRQLRMLQLCKLANNCELTDSISTAPCHTNMTQTLLDPSPLTKTIRHACMASVSTSQLGRAADGHMVSLVGMQHTLLWARSGVIFSICCRCRLAHRHLPVYTRRTRKTTIRPDSSTQDIPGQSKGETIQRRRADRCSELLRRGLVLCAQVQGQY